MVATEKLPPELKLPTIVFASPKGGAGKSTSAVVLGCELARKGAAVIIIDADPNHPVTQWARRDGKPETLEVASGVTEESIIDLIESSAAQAPFVIVDLEGTASMMVAYAISRADLVIIPTQGSQLDANEAAKAIRLIRQQEKAFSRQISFAVLFTRTNPAVRPRTLRHIRDQFAAHGVPVLATQMNEREAYRAIFSFGGTVRDLDPAQVSNLDNASTNAEAFAVEVIARLRAAREQVTESAVA
jgi:chromosome partitioning protein